MTTRQQTWLKSENIDKVCQYLNTVIKIEKGFYILFSAYVQNNVSMGLWVIIWCRLKI